MKKLDFRVYAAELAREQARQSMAPVIEKEIVHYEVLNALDEQGLLNRLSFQGGTCLRLCYGGVRYSEDLDFAAGDAFGSIEPAVLEATLKKSLEQRFDVQVRIKRPKTSSPISRTDVKRWWAIIDTAPERPDLPSQRIKVEIANVPAHTRTVRRLELHYPALPASYGTVLVPCQTLTEILADKVIAFANTGDCIRYRDLWDIPWIMQQPSIDQEELHVFVCAKHSDYHCEMPLMTMLKVGAAKAAEQVRSSAFRNEMERFIPADIIKRTLDRPAYIDAMAADLVAVFGGCLGACVDHALEEGDHKRVLSECKHADYLLLD